MTQRGGEYQRLELVFEMLHKYLDRAWSDIELAEELGTDRGNIWRIRTLMEKNLGLPIEKHPTLSAHYYIHSDYEIRHIAFNRPQMAALYLAGRRLQQQTRTNQKHVAVMLHKVARALHKPLTESLVKSAQAILEQEQDLRQEQIFTTLIECWVEQVPVRITHRKLHGQARTYLVEPYQIEPALWGDSDYLIGKSDWHKGLAIFKIARIEKAVKSTGNFTIPLEFNVHELLKHAWGIWQTDNEPITVKLRFNKWVVPRVKETIWHPNAVLHDSAEDGSCEWEVQVAEWQEMIPWIRGWGADVEAIEPTELRHYMEQEVRHLAHIYGISDLKPVVAKPIAHTKNTNGDCHDLVQHIQSVARLSLQFAESFGAGAIAFRLGLWHDVGKFSPAFQQYLLDAEQNPGRKQRGPDHKAAGSQIATKLGFPIFSLLIQGHHGGLQTKIEYERWFEEKKDKIEQSIDVAKQYLPEIFEKPSLTIPDFVRKNPHSAEFFLRMLFSALVDADYLDTEAHFNPERSIVRLTDITFEELWDRFEYSHNQLQASATESLVNRVRQELYCIALEATGLARGLFRGAVPTGGGKTLLMMAFALRHALQHGMKRVIVAVPFITITEQTANVYRNVFEKEADEFPIVLEHHSGANEETNNSATDSAQSGWNRLAAENWDAPIVVTTTVQLFESLFANGTSPCRKLHRLANSVIILDEAQALPVGLLDPILDSLRELCENYGSSVVLSTATQPAFEVIKPFKNVSAREIIPQPERFFRQLSRVMYEWRLDPKPGWSEVAEWMRNEKQVLTIVNTKKDAMALLDSLNDPSIIHLSTLLCGAHRKKVVAEIRRRLKAGEPCKVVSTQVVEAGVDIDFPLVMRAFGPLDSIIQAAGRANREGLLSGKGRVIIFDPAEGSWPIGNYRIARDTTRTLLYEGVPDMDDPESITRFFREYYTLPNSDEAGIQALRKSLNYPEVNRQFQMIEDNTVSVVVDYSESRAEIADLVEKLRYEIANRRALLRQLQPYLVSIYTKQAKDYVKQGFISPILSDEDGNLILGQWQGEYDDIRGLTIKDLNPDKLVL